MVLGVNPRLIVPTREVSDRTSGKTRPVAEPAGAFSRLWAGGLRQAAFSHQRPPEEQESREPVGRSSSPFEEVPDSTRAALAPRLWSLSWEAEN
jgi:hypothetical protein